MADSGAWPRVVLVTDRRRLTAAMGMGSLAWEDALVAQIRGAVEGGADLVQVREPDLDAGPLASFLRRLFTEVPGARARVILNDRLDVALAVGASGVHLPEQSFRVRDVRRLLAADTTYVVGRSVHDVASVDESRGAAYLVAGTVTPSASKVPGWRILGWEGLRQVAERASPVPVVAIGGLSERDVPRVRAAGAVGIAGIGTFLPSGRGDLTNSVQERVRKVRLAFDTPGGVFYTQGSGR